MTADDDDKSFQKNGQTMIEKESTVGFNVDEVFRKVNAKLLLALLVIRFVQGAPSSGGCVVAKKQSAGLVRKHCGADGQEKKKRKSKEKGKGI